jgi:hypothetical protein
MALPAYSGAGGFDSQFFYAYKHIYNENRVQDLVYKNRPFFQMLTKKDMFEGDTYNHTIMFEDPQGGSANFATAQQQRQASKQGARFVINRGREYQAIQIGIEEIEASRSDKGSLMRKRMVETDGVLNEMGRRIDIALHGNGSGVIAAFTTGTSVAGVNQVTLNSPTQGIRFSVGMYLQVATNSPSDGTAPTLAAGGNAVQVTARSVSNAKSVLTLSAGLDTLGLSTSTTYYFVRNGCGMGFGLASPYGGVSGLKSWLPLVAPVSGDNFWGYDRSIDANRLSGCRYIAAAGEKMEVTLQNASAELEVQEGTANVALMHPTRLAQYSLELGSKARYEMGVGTTGVTGMNTGGIIVQGQSGAFKAIADPQVDPELFYLLDTSTWWLATLKQVPHLDNSDGLTALREQTSDALSIRWRAWYQLICDAPGKNMVGVFGY